MKIVLIQLPHFYGGGLSRPPTYYPLGLGYVVSALNNNGIEYEILDFWLEQTKMKDAIRRTERIHCDVLGISAYSTQYAYLKEFTLKLKEIFPDIPIICGGSAATFSPAIVLKHTGVDICTIGEGEETILDLLDNMDNPHVVKGIVFKDKKRVINRTEPRAQINDLSRIPFPDREAFDQERYIINFSKDRKRLRGLRGINIITGRGCPYNCNYCSRIFRGYRFRPVEDIVNELSYLKDKFNINYVEFDDNLMIINKEKTIALCQRIKPLNIKWACQGRINVVDEEILVTMKEAGCREIGYGIESVSQSILDNMNKEIKAESIIPVVEMTKRIGIKPIIQYMYGYQGENDQTIAKTEYFFRTIDDLFIGSTTTPLPGSTLYQQCLDRGLIGDEEKYLMHLDSGFTGNNLKVNMTDFSDEEYIPKKIELMRRVNTYYFKKHPLKRILYWIEKIRHIFKLAFLNPDYFAFRVKEILKAYLRGR